MSCPRCQHTHFVKNGFVTQKQCYKWKKCDHQWTEKTHRGRPLSERALAAFLYCHGLPMNAIAKILHASPSTILRWICHFGIQHAKPSNLIGLTQCFKGVLSEPFSFKKLSDFTDIF